MRLAPVDNAIFVKGLSCFSSVNTTPDLVFEQTFRRRWNGFPCLTTKFSPMYKWAPSKRGSSMLFSRLNRSLRDKTASPTLLSLSAIPMAFVHLVCFQSFLSSERFFKVCIHYCFYLWQMHLLLLCDHCNKVTFCIIQLLIASYLLYLEENDFQRWHHACPQSPSIQWARFSNSPRKQLIDLSTDNHWQWSIIRIWVWMLYDTFKCNWRNEWNIT